MSRSKPIPAILLLGVLATQHVGVSHAQWLQTTGPKGGSVRSLLAVPNGPGIRLYAGQSQLWSTDNGGAIWKHLDNGLSDPNAFTLLALPNGSGGNDILVGTNTGVYRSTDDGASWSSISQGLPNESVYALTSGPDGVGGTNLYAGMFNGNAFLSKNNGSSWTPIQSGLPLGYNVNGMTTTATGTVLAGTMNGIYRSTDFGTSWTRVFTFYAFSFAKQGSTLYAGTNFGVYRSTNDGATWTAINNGISGSWTYSLAAVPNGSGVTLFAGAGRVMRSTDNGASWQIADNGITGIGLYALATVPNGSGGTDLYAGGSEGVFRSSDNGDHWTNVSFIASSVRALEVTPSGAILAGTESEVFRSLDGGDTWTDINANHSPFDFAVNPNGPNGVSLFVCGSPTGVGRSIDDGLTWSQSPNSLPDLDVSSVVAIPNGSGGSNILAGAYSGIYLSGDEGENWAHVEPALLALDWAVTPNGSGGHNIWGGGFGGVWKSTNYGLTWTASGVLGTIVQAMATTGNGATIFAGGDPIGIYRSTDQGATWVQVSNGLSDPRIYALYSPDGIHVFAGGRGGVYLSADNGNTWTSVGIGLTTGVFSLAGSADGQTLLAGTIRFGVWKRALSEMIGTTSTPDDVESSRPNVIALRGNQPNPFSQGTTIQFTVPRAMHVRLVVYDVSGRAVRTLYDGIQEMGERQVAWNGRDDTGSRMARGMYLYRLEAGGTSRTRKMILE